MLETEYTQDGPIKRKALQSSTGWYVFGLLVPLAGLILGIMFGARDRVGPMFAMWMTSFIGVYVWVILLGVSLGVSGALSTDAVKPGHAQLVVSPGHAQPGDDKPIEERLQTALDGLEDAAK